MRGSQLACASQLTPRGPRAGGGESDETRAGRFKFLPSGLTGTRWLWCARSWDQTPAEVRCSGSYLAGSSFLGSDSRGLSRFDLARRAGSLSFCLVSHPAGTFFGSVVLPKKCVCTRRFGPLADRALPLARFWWRDDSRQPSSLPVAPITVEVDPVASSRHNRYNPVVPGTYANNAQPLERPGPGREFNISTHKSTLCSGFAGLVLNLRPTVLGPVRFPHV